MSLPCLQPSIPVHFADDYLRGDGSDESAAFTAMLTAVTAAGTKAATIHFGPRTYRVNSQIILPCDPTTRKQPTIVFQGEGNGHPGGAPWGNSYAQNGGISGPMPGATILDLRYDAPAADATRAKIHTYGHGAFYLRDLCLLDGSVGLISAGTQANGTGFIYTTNTAVIDERVYYCGPHRRTGVDEAQTPLMTAVLYGGTNIANVATLNADAPFQGYGSYSVGCFFSRVARLRHFKTYANAITNERETCDTSCKGTECYRFDGGVNVCAGNQISFGTYECVNFTAFARGNKAVANAFLYNGIYDGGGFAAHFIFEDTGSTNNVIHTLMGDDAHPWLSEAAPGTNILHSNRQGLSSQTSQAMTYIDSGSPTVVIQRSQTGGNVLVGGVTLRAIDATNNVTTTLGQSFSRSHSTGFEFLRFFTSTDPKNLFYISRLGAERTDIVTDRTDFRLQSGGELRLVPGAGGTVWFGSEGWINAGQVNARGLWLRNGGGEVRVDSAFRGSAPTGSAVGGITVYRIDGTVWGVIEVKAPS